MLCLRSPVHAFAVAALSAHAAQPQAAAPPVGTYEFVLCHPTCADSAETVGRGVLVIVDRDILPLLSSQPRDVLGFRGTPNACFRVSAQSSIKGREYYPSIIPAAATRVAPVDSGRFTVQLYQSPDAFFSVILRFDSSGAVLGQGRQHDFDGRGPPDFTRLAGRRVGPAKPDRCRL